MPDVIEDGRNGVFTDGTPADLAEKIRFVLSDDERRGSIGEAGKSVLDRFEREKLIAQYVQFLQSFGNVVQSSHE